MSDTLESKINIGSKLKSIRERSGFTQSNIAKYLRVDQSFVSKLETGERVLTTDMLEKLAALFGVSLAVFLNDTVGEDKPLALTLRANEISEEDMDVIGAINRIALNCDFMTQLLGGARDN
ncbi:MAG: helix-turn-helix transcriptional regulator [Syntrophomonadaceae bacterium]|nr:helix-turn-helix transcriptional regulator [Syntrophomonadaceae bacterium]